MVEFPISGPYRQLLLTLELIVLFTFMELFAFFFYKYWKNRKEQKPSIIEFDWAVIFAVFGVAKIFFIMSDFYDFDRLIYPVFGYFSLAIGGNILLYHIEFTKTLKTKYILTVFLGIFTAVLLIVLLLSPSLVKAVTYSLAICAYIIMFFYFSMMVKRIWNQYRFYALGLFFGIIFWVLGFTGTSDAAAILFNGVAIRLAGDIAILASLLCMGLFLTSIPSIAEIGWQEKIKYIILSKQNGVLLYSENFREKKKEINEVLVAGALCGIQNFLQTVLSSNLEVLSKGTDVILMERGKYVTGILIVEQELEILKFLLKKLVKQFEYFYANIFENWNGDISIFKPTVHLVNDIFSLKKV